MQRAKEIVIVIVVLLGIFLGIRLIGQIVEKSVDSISKAVDPYMEEFAIRLRNWTRPLWEERPSPRKDLEDLNRYLEELNRMTDEHQRRLRGQ